MTDRERIEAAFQAGRAELEIRGGFPDEVMAAAEAAAARNWRAEPRRDFLDLPFVTVDPPGSRDLDQALHLAPIADGYRVHYAIADLGSFVRRGDPVEREAWLRGVTYYAPDHREPLYPVVLSQGAASLLADEERPAIVFTIDIDAAGALVSMEVERGRIRSRAQLTYHQVRERVLGGSASVDAPYAESLRLLKVVGELRIEQEKERGGVSLPIREQHVQERSALRLGYELAYEEPNVAEEWNAQISLLTGHAAAEKMLAAGVGLLRTSPPSGAEEIERVRVTAKALGFLWPEARGYAEFMHALDPAHPNLDTLVWQARRLMRGADYVAFNDAPPPQAQHSALAMSYSHCTAPLRRLADRYVLDLLLELERAERPSEEEVDTLFRLPAVMDESERKASRLERRVVDVAEAWTLRERVGERFTALVLDSGRDGVDLQITEPPVRARLAPARALDASVGEELMVRLTGVDLEDPRLVFEPAAT